MLCSVVVFGGRVTLSGIVPTHRTGEQVVAIITPIYGGGSFERAETVLTGRAARGPSSREARDRYYHLPRADVAEGGMSALVSIGVHP